MIALRPAHCAIGLFTSTVTGEVVYARCGSWTCEICGPRKVRRFRLRLLAARQSWTYFLTLTLPASCSGEPTPENRKYLQKCWRQAAQFLRRNYGLTHYVWVNELGERTSRLHKHLLLKCRTIDYRKAGERFARLGLGRQCRFERPRSQTGVQAYLVNYLSKGLNSLWPRYARRFATTLPALPRAGKGEWMFQKFVLPRRVTEFAERRLERALSACSISASDDVVRSLAALRGTRSVPVLCSTPEEKVHHEMSDEDVRQALFSTRRRPWPPKHQIMSTSLRD